MLIRCLRRIFIAPALERRRANHHPCPRLKGGELWGKLSKYFTVCKTASSANRSPCRLAVPEKIFALLACSIFSTAAGEGPSGQITACSTHRLGSVTSCYRFAVTPIKCAAGALKAYLRCRTDDAFASFVSSRSLSVRGSWGTAPSVFWFLLYAQKERLRGERCLLCLCKRLRDADRRDEIITFCRQPLSQPCG